MGIQVQTVLSSSIGRLSSIGRFRNRLIGIITGLVILLSLCACSPGAATGTSRSTATQTDLPAVTTAATATDASATDATDDPTGIGKGPSGPLRIWWTPRTSLNPLQEDSKAGLAVNDLIFQGLFRIREDQSIEPQLARNLTVWQSGLQVLVILDEGRLFHDGSPVTLEDAAACISYIINPANQSIYAAGLSAVLSVQVIDGAALELQLSRPDPWIAYALTFPIIPAASLNAEPGALIPGTGRYQMASFGADNSLRLVSSSDAGLGEIVVRAYDDQLAAMQAMEKDELDLVYLDARDCSRYMLRSSLRLSLFPGNELYITLCNTIGGNLLSDAARLAFVKQTIQASSLIGTDAARWGHLTSLGIPDGSWLSAAFQADATSGQLDAYAARLDRLILPGATWAQLAEDDETALQIVVAAEDERRMNLAQILAGKLAEQGIPSSVVPLTVDLYWPALQSGAFDLAVLTAVLPDSPDPAWPYRPVHFAPWSAIDPLLAASTGLDEYDVWQDKLMRIVPDDYRQMNGTLESDATFAATLVETAVRSPWNTLELLTEGLAYGDRVYGQCKPNRYHPYQNVEELWVWSGQ